MNRRIFTAPCDGAQWFIFECRKVRGEFDSECEASLNALRLVNVAR